MKLIENMTPPELEAEKRLQLRRIETAKAALERINGQKDYSDEISKHFHLGKVGFRKDTKKQAQTLNRAIYNGVKACGHYDTIEEAEGRLQTIYNAENLIAKNGAFGDTARQIKENKHKAAVEAAPTLKWEKMQGHYGPAYKHGDFTVERVDTGFVAVKDTKGNLLSHYKTVKEAKAAVSLTLERSHR